MHVLHDPRVTPSPRGAELPQVRRVSWQRPLVWLGRGWQDLAALRGHSLAYGVFVAGFGLALLAVASQLGALLPALVGGFLLVAPMVALGLYALSRQREAGIPPDAGAALFAWRANATSLGLFGLLLALALIFWERVAAIVVALFYGGQLGGTLPEPALLVGALLFSPEHLPLRLAFFGSGALLAALVYALSVVSAPLLLDRPIDVVSACLCSLRCCARNPAATAFWALLIAALTALGFATAMLGLVVIFPWLGHASWHAYRDLVE